MRLPDFRVQGRCLHKLRAVMMLVLGGMLANGEDFEEIEDFGNGKKEYLWVP